MIYNHEQTTELCELEILREFLEKLHRKKILTDMEYRIYSSRIDSAQAEAGA